MPDPSTIEISAMWHSVLTEGHVDKPSSYLPGSPRCRICDIPVGGIGGKVVKVLRGRVASRLNPQICNQCDEVLPRGGAEIDIAVLFADVRGSTALGESLGPRAFADVLNEFYAVSHDVLVPRGAMIDKMIGDEVMAFFIPALDPHYRQMAIDTAIAWQKAILTAKGGEPLLPVGIGVHAGMAFVGKVGTEDVSDMTALGDTVNTGARLQSVAQPGEVAISEELASAAPAEFDNAERRTVDIRGRQEPLDVRVLAVTA